MSTDACYYLGDYTARGGFVFSETNDLIQNLKKPMDRRTRPEWRYKISAIDRAAKMLREALPRRWVSRVTFVPMPPSKMRTHAEYDDRLLQILSKVGDLAMRELLVATEDVEPAHLTEQRRNVADVIQALRLDGSLRSPTPEALCVFDDVLTTGAHLKAAQSISMDEYPNVPLAGLFLARRAPEASPI